VRDRLRLVWAASLAVLLLLLLQALPGRRQCRGADSVPARLERGHASRRATLQTPSTMLERYLNTMAGAPPRAPAYTRIWSGRRASPPPLPPPPPLCGLLPLARRERPLEMGGGVLVEVDAPATSSDGMGWDEMR
jgi:hypothetical protein